MPRPRPASPPPRDDRVQTGIRFDRSVIADARAEADRRGISLNKLVNMAVAGWLTSHRTD